MKLPIKGTPVQVKTLNVRESVLRNDINDWAGHFSTVQLNAGQQWFQPSDGALTVSIKKG